MMNVQKVKEALDDCAGLYVLADGIQAFEDFEGGEPNLGTLKNLQTIKKASLKAREALAELKNPVDVKTYYIDENGIADHCATRYVLLDDAQSYAESYHANLCRECKALPEEPEA